MEYLVTFLVPLSARHKQQLADLVSVNGGYMQEVKATPVFTSSDGEYLIRQTGLSVECLALLWFGVGKSRTTFLQHLEEWCKPTLLDLPSLEGVLDHTIVWVEKNMVKN